MKKCLYKSKALISFILAVSMLLGIMAVMATDAFAAAAGALYNCAAYGEDKLIVLDGSNSGSLEWSNAQKILTLSGISLTYESAEDINGVISVPAGSTIVLEGNNVFNITNNQNSKFCGIEGKGDFTVIGGDDDSLEINIVQAESKNIFGIAAAGNTVFDADVSINISGNGSNNYGISTQGTSTISVLKNVIISESSISKNEYGIQSSSELNINVSGNLEIYLNGTSCPIAAGIQIFGDLSFGADSSFTFDSKTANAYVMLASSAAIDEALVSAGGVSAPKPAGFTGSVSIAQSAVGTAFTLAAPEPEENPDSEWGNYVFILPSQMRANEERINAKAKAAKAKLYSSYKDLGDFWYSTAVAFCLEKEYFRGYGNGYFGPNDPITAAELTQVMRNMLKGQNADELTEGGKVLDFGSSKTLTREEVAKTFYKYIQYQGGGFKGAWMYYPRETITRAEVCQIIYNYLNK